MGNIKKIKTTYNLQWSLKTLKLNYFTMKKVSNPHSLSKRLLEFSSDIYISKCLILTVWNM